MVRILNNRVRSIAMDNNLLGNGTLQLEFPFSFNVNYATDNRHCKALLTTNIKSKNDTSLLKVLVVLETEFETDKEITFDNKKSYHIECYKSMFPFAQSLMAELCIKAGINPIYIPQANMTEEDIKIG